MVPRRTMRKFGKLLKNKKGFTLVEAIAVVAIMGVLATVIGGLVTAGTTAYMRQKENAAAKDLGTIVQNEIKQKIRTSLEVYLQSGSLAPRTNAVYNTEGVEVGYSMLNAPSGDFSAFFTGDNGRLMYAKYSTDGSETTSEYFTDPSREAEGRAFYGGFTTKVFFKPIINTFGEVVSVKVFCDVYNKKGQLKFDSPGIEVDFIEADYDSPKSDASTFKGIFSFSSGDLNAVTAAGDSIYKYNNMLLNENYMQRFADGFSTIYFKTVRTGD